MVLFPIGLGGFFHRHFSISWKVFFIAIGFYLINLVVQIPFTAYLWPTLFGKMLWILLAFTTLTYGITEETMRYLSFRTGKTMRANRTANGALMAGVGHGGAESVLFALQAIMGILIALFMPQILKAQGLHTNDILGMPWWFFIGSGLSRILAITAHMGFATLIVLAYRRSWLFYPLAIVAHFVVDFSTFGIQSLTKSLLWSLLVFVLWAVVALVLIVYVRRSGIAHNTAPEEQTGTGKQTPAVSI